MAGITYYLEQELVADVVLERIKTILEYHGRKPLADYKSFDFRVCMMLNISCIFYRCGFLHIMSYVSHAPEPLLGPGIFRLKKWKFRFKNGQFRFFCFNAQFRCFHSFIHQITFFSTIIEVSKVGRCLETGLKTLEINYSLASGLESHPDRKMGSYNRPD